MSFLLDIIDFVITIFCYLLMARLLLQIAQADFYNPISQVVVRFSNPLVNPVQKIIPPIGGFSLATFLILLALQAGFNGMLYWLSGQFSNILALALIRGCYEVLYLAINIYIFSFLIIFVSSWIAPGSPHPGIRLVYQIAEPLLRPVRNLIPPIGGLDLSLMVAGFAMYMFQKHLIAPLFSYLLASVQ